MKMKLFKLLLLAITTIGFTSLANAQSGPPAPGTGIYAIIDTTYDVGSTTLGVTKAKITLKNSTSTKYTAVQFRVFYDKVAFTNASVALLGSSTNLDMQQVVSTSNGYVTITLVYTGSSSTYSITDAETFEITFTHAAGSTFNTLSAITDLKFTGTATFAQTASTQAGFDTTLDLYSYGGVFTRPTLKYHGTFTNVTGTAAKNLTLALEKKPKSGSTWTQVNSYTTNTLGKFSFTEILDTTYWDVRLAVKGDTLGLGNAISTADAQKINQWAIGAQTPAGFDFYTGDVNGSKGLTITDAYGVFGRVAGRFTAWPNSVPEIKFFTQSEYNTITGTPTTNYTSTIAGVTNFYFNILPGQPDSVTYYVMVPGDANGTGYHMARITPIQVGVVGAESQIYNVIDQRVEYDFATSTIEVNVPKLKVDEGSLVNIPIKVLTNGNSLSALQFGLKFNDTLLAFKGVYGTPASQKWVTYLNPNNGQIDWGGYDNTNNEHSLNDGDEVVTLQFEALKPQAQWVASPLYTTNKFAGLQNSKDLNIIPTNGVLQVMRVSGGHGNILKGNTMEVYPNPTNDLIHIVFKVAETTDANISVTDINGKMCIQIMSGQIPEGQFVYSTSLGNLSAGIYIATVHTANGKAIAQRIVKQN
jgi:hypothetical protein